MNAWMLVFLNLNNFMAYFVMELSLWCWVDVLSSLPVSLGWFVSPWCQFPVLALSELDPCTNWKLLLAAFSDNQLFLCREAFSPLRSPFKSSLFLFCLLGFLIHQKASLHVVKWVGITRRPGPVTGLLLAKLAFLSKLLNCSVPQPSHGQIWKKIRTPHLWYCEV